MTQIPNLAGLAQRKQQLDAQAKAGEAAFRIQLARELFVKTYATENSGDHGWYASDALKAADAFMVAIKEKANEPTQP